MIRSRLLAIAKPVVGVGLIAALLWTVDVPLLLTRLRTIELPYLGLVLVLPHLGILVSTVKWQMLLRALTVRVRIRRLLNLYLIGTFFSSFLPTMVGGDVVRSYALFRQTGNAWSVSAATFLERFIGLAALVTLLPLAAFQPLIKTAIPMANALALGIVGAYLLVVLVVSLPILKHADSRLAEDRFLGRVWGFLVTTHDRIRSFRAYPRVLVLSYLNSLFFYCLAVATVWAAAESLHVELDALYLAGVVPIVLLAALLPITLNGLGVTEVGYVLFLQLAGVSLEAALGIALLLRMRLVLTALIGGLVFLWYRLADDESLAGTRIIALRHSANEGNHVDSTAASPGWSEN